MGQPMATANLFEKLFKKNTNDVDYIFYYDYPVSLYDYKLQNQLKMEFGVN